VLVVFLFEGRSELESNSDDEKREGREKQHVFHVNLLVSHL
jgi:hypothetical protein